MFLQLVKGRREGEREGGRREGGREGEREGERERGREGRREGEWGQLMIPPTINKIKSTNMLTLSSVCKQNYCNR